MKKTLPFIIVLVLLVGVGIYYVATSKPATAPTAEQGDNTGNQTAADNASLLDWLKGGKSVQCVLSTAEGAMTVMAKNDAIRIEGIPYAFSDNNGQSQPSTSLTLGDWVYYWSGQEGVKYNITAANTTSDDSGMDNSETDNVDWENWAQSMEDEGVSYDCSEKSFSNDLFSPPGDVNFVDLTALSNQAQQLGQGMEENLPASGTPSQDDILKQLENLKANMPTGGDGPPTE